MGYHGAFFICLPGDEQSMMMPEIVENYCLV